MTSSSFDKHKRILNGIISEVSCNAIFYPLNTLKTNSQIGKIVCKNPITLFKGFKMGLRAEMINSIVFHSIYECMQTNSLVKSTCGSVLAVVCSHPLTIRRKLLQTHKKIDIIKLKDNYRGLNLSIANTVPGTSINYCMRDAIRPLLSDDVKNLSGVISSFVSILITHPIDSLSTCVSTKTKIKKCLNYDGLRERLLEKNLVIGGKMFLLEILNDVHK